MFALKTCLACYLTFVEYETEAPLGARWIKGGEEAACGKIRRLLTGRSTPHAIKRYYG